MSDDDDTDDCQPVAGMQASPPVASPRFDAANRLQRSIDVQIRTIEGIDDKAEHVTRLLGVLLGAILSVLSVGAEFDSVSFADAETVTWIAFIVGVSSLVLSMATAVVTYLSSKFPVGMNENAGKLLSDPGYDTDMEQHLRRLVGNYAGIIQMNRSVIETNSRRFRWSLVLLLSGIIFLSTATVLFVGDFRRTVRLGILTAVACSTGLLSWYVVSGSYLTVEELGVDNER